MSWEGIDDSCLHAATADVTAFAFSTQCLLDWTIGDNELLKFKIFEPAVAAFVVHILVASTCQSWIGCFDWYMSRECLMVCIGLVYFVPWDCPRCIPNKYCSATTVWPTGSLFTNTFPQLMSPYLHVSLFQLSILIWIHFDLQQLVSEKDLIVREEACRVGLLFGGFTGSYHALRCFLRRFRKKETPYNA